MGFLDRVRDMANSYFQWEAPKTPEKKESEPLPREAGVYVVSKDRARTIPDSPEEIEAAEKLLERCDDSAVAVQVDSDFGVYGVFDGVGGNAGGWKASQLARDAFALNARAFRAGGLDSQIQARVTERLGDVELTAQLRREEMLKISAEQAKLDMERFVEDQIKRGNKTFNSMTTTVSAFASERLPDGTAEVSFVNSGDSTVFRFSKEWGELAALTRGHTFAQLLAEKGVIDEDTAYKIEQSEQRGRDVETGKPLSILIAETEALMVDEDDDHVRRQLENIYQKLLRLEQKTNADVDTGMALYNLRNNITASLGPEYDAHLDVGTVVVDEGDIVFAVSDLVTDSLTEEQIQTEVANRLEQGQTIQEILEGLIETAREVTGPRKKSLDDGSGSGLQIVMRTAVAAGTGRMEDAANDQAQLEEAQRRAASAAK